MRFNPSLALGFLMTVAALPAYSAQLVRICIDDKPSFYFYNKAGTEKSEHPGLVFDLIRHLQTQMNLDIRVMRRARHACTILLEKGDIDVIGLSSYSKEREKVGLFPMKNGEADADRAVVRTSYYLYTLKSKPLAWDGKDLSSLKGHRLAAMEGFSIVHDLEQAGAKVETFKSIEGMLTRLQKDDIDGVAAHYDMIKRLGGEIALQKHEKPLATKDYFLQVSRLFQEKYPALPEAIWKESAHFLKTAQGQAAVSKYEKLENFP